MTFRDLFSGDTAGAPGARLDLVSYEDRISIPTPEGVELELVLAGVGSRLVGSLVDFLIKAVLLFALWLVSAVAAEDAGGFFIALTIIASFLVFWAYDVAFETLASGRTPGKRAAGLRVVRMGGEPVGFLASAVRNLLRLVDMQPGFLFAVGAITILFSQRNQRLGDLAAGTLVVRERLAPLPAVRPAVPDFATRRPLRRLGRERRHRLRARHRPALPGAPLAARPRCPWPPRLGDSPNVSAPRWPAPRRTSTPSSSSRPWPKPKPPGGSTAGPARSTVPP